MVNQRHGLGPDMPVSPPVIEDETLQEAENDPDQFGAIEGPTSTGHPDIWRVCWKVPRVVRDNIRKVNSPPFEISGVAWSILLQLTPQSADEITTLGVFLDAAAMETVDPAFQITAVFEICAENKDPAMSQRRPLFHEFHRQSSDWGFRDLVRDVDVADESAGFLVDDTLSISVIVRVLKEDEFREYNIRGRQDPNLWLHDPKTETGYVGLKNQGATCYMNSLLQSLYHVPALQRAVYKMPTEQESSAKRQRSVGQHPMVISRPENGNTQESVALALQRVFYHLQHSNKSVGTKQLTKSFGWDALDAFTQHDVQELDRVLCDNLEEKMKGTVVENEVPRLLRGKLKNFVKCINVNFTSERIEDFYDLSMNVRGCKNLRESFEKYIEREKLDGDNKYMAEGHGLQDAEKGCAFVSFPPVLHLHLKRFEYDPIRDANVKINDRFEFDEEIDLAPYLEEDPGHPELYQLHSVMVHSGDVHGGHYYAYIRPDCKDKWYKFNDERVSISNRQEAIDDNFGCDEDSDRLPLGQSVLVQRNRMASRKFSNAYMIVYVKKNAVGEVLKPLVQEDIPTHLRQRFQIEQEEEELRRKEKAEAHLKLTLRVTTWKHLEKFKEADLHDWQDILMLQVLKTMTLDGLKKTIIETADIKADDIRIWPCCKRKNETIRTQSPMRAKGATELREIRQFSQNTSYAQDGVKIFVEELSPESMPTDEIEERDALIFFKIWNPDEQCLRYLGHHIFKPTTLVSDMVETARARFLPDVEREDIEALEELKPDKIENLVYKVHDERGGVRDAQLQDKQVELQSGDIIVIQSADVSRTESCVKYHYDYLYNKVLVSFRAKSSPDKDAFEMYMHGNLTYDQVCAKVAHSINALNVGKREMPAAGDKMQLFKHAIDRGPSSSPAERKADFILRDLLYFHAEKNIVYYEELWYSVHDLRTKMLMRFKMINKGKVELQECLVDRGPAAVKEALDHAAKVLPPEESPPELILCSVRAGTIQDMFPAIMEYDCREDLLKASDLHNLAVISVSARAGGVMDGHLGGYLANDERCLRGWLLKVSHFEFNARSMRERNNVQTGTTQSVASPRTYGDPLLVRVTAGETVGEMKRKVRHALMDQCQKLSDVESSDVKVTDWAFWLFSNKDPEELDQDDQTLLDANCTDLDCFIGVEHPDKHRYANTMRTVEKAIRISR